MLCQVRFGSVRLGYISFLSQTQAHAVSISEHYEDTTFVRFVQIRLGNVMLGYVWLGTVWLGYISFYILLPQSLARAVSISKHYEDTVFVRLWLDQVMLGLVRYGLVWLYKLFIFYHPKARHVLYLQASTMKIQHSLGYGQIMLCYVMFDQVRFGSVI